MDYPMALIFISRHAMISPTALQLIRFLRFLKKSER